MDEVVELTAEEMSARQAAAEEIMKRNKEKEEREIDEAADQLTDLIVQEREGAAWENQSMSQMSKLSSTSCRYEFKKLFFRRYLDF